MKSSLFLVFLALVLIGIDTASAYQRAFYGGSFTQADGIHSLDLAVYDAESQGWRRVPPPGIDADGTIYDHHPVGDNGVIIVGTFQSINNGVPSFGVAFFDGTKWCAISQGLAADSELNNYKNQGYATAVWCNSATSCWVVGYFSYIENLPVNAPNNPSNFAHYIRSNESSSDWVFDTSVIEWNNQNSPGTVLPLGDYPTGPLPVPGTLQGVPSDDPKYFFVGISSNSNYGTQNGFDSIWRGGKEDGGWRSYYPSGMWRRRAVGPADVRGFKIDADSASPAAYVVTTRGTPSTFAYKSTVVLRPCPIGSCPSVTAPSEWVSLVPENTGSVVGLYDVVPVNSSSRYYIGLYSPGPGYNNRFQVLYQDGFTAPLPVGAPFAQATTYALNRISLFEGKPMVIGSFTTANLFYPDQTNDFEGNLGDIRALDSVNYVAVLGDNGEWTSAFGGGLGPSVSSDDDMALTLIVRHNKNSNTWTLTSPDFNFVHNVKAEGLAYYDDAKELNGKNIYPLFTRRLAVRGGSTTQVYDVACETPDCEFVYAGGYFAFHGDQYALRTGSVKRLERRNAEACKEAFSILEKRGRTVQLHFFRITISAAADSFVILTRPVCLHLFRYLIFASSISYFLLTGQQPP
jgi:hypothetical protein